MKFVIVGTGRCGTGYMSKLLTNAGVPCGHESIYTVDGIIKPLKTLSGDSSWLAVPHLSKLKGTKTKVIHIVRDPLKVFRSWLFDQNNIISLKPTKINSPYNDYIRKAYPSIDKQNSQIDKAAVYYMGCNLNIVRLSKENMLDYSFFRVEDDPSELIYSLGGNISTEYKHLSKENSRDKGIAGDKEVLSLLSNSDYCPDLVDAFTTYYPDLYSRETLLGGTYAV